MTQKPSPERSKFAQKFADVYGSHPLPAVYRNFILSDSYLPYRKAVIHDLPTYGPTEVELRLAGSALLDRDQLFEDSDIQLDEADEYHPIAIVRHSPQFLAIDRTIAAAPVFLWHHETGAFERVFDTFELFIENLRTPEQLETERRATLNAIARIYQVCEPALARSQGQFDRGDLEAAKTEVDAALHGHNPIEYDGTNDFEAIGILCACYNLRGRILLAQGCLEPARAAFLEAMSCGGRPYWEAVVDAIFTSILLEDITVVFDLVGSIHAEDFPFHPSTIVRRNFTQDQIERVKRIGTFRDDQRAFVEEVLKWAVAAQP
jgi:hypothetical protein